jgi:hypothetical protein
MEYCITHKRQLIEKEKELLQFLFSKEKPECQSLIDNLKIIARCGCEKCPTILFGYSFDDEVKRNQSLIIDYIGKGENRELIGVSLFGNNEMPTELEFYSIDGQNEVTERPIIKTLKPLNSK